MHENRGRLGKKVKCRYLHVITQEENVSPYEIVTLLSQPWAYWEDPQMELILIRKIKYLSLGK